ncbi:FAD-dependent oxidoreductase [Kutzneria viridogrisea]|uniref:Pentachlorophenol monooxygenase/3-(3-hydroxy-phenyl)propionate hydroxylase n=1 Tax=Kutzneria viridogrisea TaxID=47990 RepID=A0ABR6BJD3_9PSEU|nr:pentachlorophenol monooxygenase/3-(3-hydroxy-phenyl)propionate hydroxylase [Kutzneria viridogrisea]
MTGRVVVIGNGPVGQSTALLLAKRGVSVVLVDRRPARDPVGSKAICQQRDVLDIWESVGAGRRIADAGLTWSRARTFHRDRELFCRELTDPGQSPFPPFVNLSQARTEQILDELIAQQPLIEVRWDHEVRELSQDANGVRAGGIAADYAVLCTGVHGADLRAQLGVSLAGQSFSDRFLICDLAADLPGWAQERRFHFDPAGNPGRQVLVHPCPGGTFRIDWQIPAGAEPGPAELDEKVRAILGEVPYRVLWRSVYRFQSKVADRFLVGRVLLAGDCAHVYSPFGARGLNSGVADAENAAWKLAHVLDGLAPPGLLETYHLERRAAALENLAVTSATMDFLVPQDERQRQYREEVLARAATDPAAWPLVDSGRLSEPFSYRDSPLTTPGTEGSLIPDFPCVGTTARQLARLGGLVLTAPGLPITTNLRVVVTDRLAPGAVQLVRPDAHLAAELTRPSTAELAAAERRMTGQPASAPLGRST